MSDNVSRALEPGTGLQALENAPQKLDVKEKVSISSKHVCSCHLYVLSLNATGQVEIRLGEGNHEISFECSIANQPIVILAGREDANSAMTVLGDFLVSHGIISAAGH